MGEEMAGDLRQRRGEGGGDENAPPSGADAKVGKPAVSEADREALYEQIKTMVNKMKEPPKPGMSHESKKWKDALQGDPYNMQLIQELGESYCVDEKWEEACNVMLRGWKRFGEIKDPLERFLFLQDLCKASFQTQKYRQALAVINDITDIPELEVDHMRHHEILRSQVYCFNGEVQKGLKSFHRAIDGAEFETASAVWAECLPGFKKVGTYDVAKSTIEGLIKSDGDRSRLEAVTKLAELKDSVRKEVVATKNPVTGFGVPVSHVLSFLALIGVFIVVYLLYRLEARSLKNTQFNK